MAATLNGASDRQKIDSFATDGLEGVSNSLAYRVHEIEKHFHGYEYWFETAAAANGEIHVADRSGTGGGSFQIDAGNDTWGNWTQILGSSDTPVNTSYAKYDLHRLLFTATERNAVYVVQLAFGTSGAAALAAGTYTEAVFLPTNNLIDSGPVGIQMARANAGTKAWARCICPGQDTATIDFMLGLHEYIG